MIFLTNKIATYNNAAPSISFGRLVAKGEKNKHAKNGTPITNEVIPVLPPAFTPAHGLYITCDCCCAIIAPATVPTLSDSIALFISCTLPFLSTLPATLATDVSVPAVSEKVNKQQSENY